MGFLDKIKGLVGQGADKAEDSLDTAAGYAKDKLPDEHDGTVDSAVAAANDTLDSVDRVDGDEDFSAD
jgi:hypothetical protein